ncbi:MAG TPA: S8 family serine peptidase, partial [Polyangiales bacterium]
MPSRFLAISVALLAGSLGCSSAEAPAALAARADSLVDEKLLNAEGTQRVIVNLRVADGALDARPARIAAVQQTLLDKRIAGFTLGRRYRHVPAISGVATAQAIEQLGRDPAVFYVQYDEPGGGQLKEAVPAIGGEQARTEFGVTGKGVRVAVLDTGVDTDHPDLKDALVAQHCFTQFACPPFGSEGTSAEDDHGHGSNVSGIIASRGVVSSRGFAPGAELVALKINDANDSGVQSDWVAGLDWLFDNLAMLKVKLVNLSIGTTAMYRMGDPAECDRAQPALAAAIKNLVDAGVTVFAATGNRGSTTSMPAPACNTGVIAVGATYDANVGRQPPTNVGATYAARWGA